MTEPTHLEAEVRAVRETAGLLDLPFLGRLRFTGGDRVTFLHNFLSNDVQSLAPGRGCYATILTQASKVVADADAFVEDDAVLVVVNERVRDAARRHLEKYLVADDVEIEDLSDRETTVAVVGPRAADVLRAAGAASPPEGDHDHSAAEVAGVPVTLARVARAGATGFDLFVPRGRVEAVRAALIDAGRERGLRSVGAAALEILRVEAGEPLVGVDFDESVLVLEAGLERGIHFKKGCYLGQETVERQAARGHVNRKLVGLRVDSTSVPPAGAKLAKDGREVGHVTSAVRSPSFGTIALGYVRREVMEPGTRIEVAVGAGSAAAEIAALPFLGPRA